MGTEAPLDHLFRAGAADIRLTPRDFAFRYKSPEHWIEVFRTWYGPVYKAFASLAPEKQQALHADLLTLIAGSTPVGTRRWWRRRSIWRW